MSEARFMSSIPRDRRVVRAAEPGGPEVLRVNHEPTPAPGAGEVLIKVAAAGVNRPDVFQRLGLYPPPPGVTDILGLEAAGEVVATGPETPEDWLGKRVCALLPGGGYADYALAEAALCRPVPESLRLEEAAALPEALVTVEANVFDIAALATGERFLVHGATSGIGVVAVQLAAAHGADVIATAGAEEKCALARTLGAARAVNYRTEDFAEIAKAAGGIDVALDMVGGDYVAREIAAMNPGGRLVFIAFLGGSQAQLDLMPVMLKRLTITGSTLRRRPVAEKAALMASGWARLEAARAAGRFRAVIDQRFALEDAAAAHARMESGAHAGKILLIP